MYTWQFDYHDSSCFSFYSISLMIIFDLEACYKLWTYRLSTKSACLRKIAISPDQIFIHPYLLSINSVLLDDFIHPCLSVILGSITLAILTSSIRLFNFFLTSLEYASVGVTILDKTRQPETNTKRS